MSDSQQYPRKKRYKQTSVHDLFLELVRCNKLIECNFFVTRLAEILVTKGCEVPTALWIAFKFEGIRSFEPSATLMARVAGMSVKKLAEMERADLQRLDYCIPILPV